MATKLYEKIFEPPKPLEKQIRAVNLDDIVGFVARRSQGVWCIETQLALAAEKIKLGKADAEFYGLVDAYKKRSKDTANKANELVNLMDSMLNKKNIGMTERGLLRIYLGTLDILGLRPEKIEELRAHIKDMDSPILPTYWSV